MVRRTLAAAGIALVAFHVWLFAGQLLTGELTDATVIARWAIAGGLIWGLHRLRRQGVSLVWGRQAISLWLLAALLHGPAVAERAGMLDAPAVPEVVATVVTSTIAIVGLGLTLLFGLLAARTRRPRHAVTTGHRATHRLSLLAPASFLLLAPRPPPHGERACGAPVN